MIQAICFQLKIQQHINIVYQKGAKKKAWHQREARTLLMVFGKLTFRVYPSLGKADSDTTPQSFESALFNTKGGVVI
jgi:hypothetical protein